MLWLQTLPAFAIWIGYIFLRRGWMMRSRASYARRSRVWRVLAMLAALFGSGIALLGGIWAAARLGWIVPGVFSLRGFIATAAVGLVFIHLQMVALALTLSLALGHETPPGSPTSDSENKPGEIQ